jgi:hypothetical protein
MRSERALSGHQSVSLLTAGPATELHLPGFKLLCQREQVYNECGQVYYTVQAPCVVEGPCWIEITALTRQAAQPGSRNMAYVACGFQIIEAEAAIIQVPKEAARARRLLREPFVAVGHRTRLRLHFVTRIAIATVMRKHTANFV